MHDAQNATFSQKGFGAQTIADVAYGRNGSESYGLQFSDSGRLERADRRNGNAIGNYMNGENIEGCEKPDVIVDSRGNQKD